jgi:uncharacterized membrane protein
MSSVQRPLWITRVLCVLGIGVAGYLAWTYVGGSEPYCGGTGSCSAVQNSRYANLAGIPVPVIGLAGYLILLGLSLLRDRVSEDLAFYLPVLNFGAVLVGFIYSAYLTYLEAMVIRAWCYWCVASAVIMTVLLILSVFDLRRVWVEA